MTAVFRSIALASVACLAISAHAGLVNFDKLPDGTSSNTLAANAGFSLFNADPNLNPYKSEGIEFRQGFAIYSHSTTPPPGKVVPGSEGYLSVDSTATRYEIFVLTGFNFDQLTLSFALPRTDPPFGTVFGRNGESATLNLVAGDWEWKTQSVDLGKIDFVDHIVFETNSKVDFFAIDNLNLSVSDQGGSVPEPTSYALVALALGAAGLATRRNRA